MTIAPPRLCGKCLRKITGPCPTCARKRDQARGTAHARGYTAEWADYSRRWLARYPWCGQRADGLRHAEHSRCTRDLHQVRATVTDHIVAIKHGGARMDPRNHQSLCGPCNRRKAIELEGGFGR